LALTALGFRTLSLTPSALGAVKAMLLDLDIKKAEAVLRPLIDDPPRDETVRQRLEAFAAAEGLQL
jgi:phosphotransferase system, enzyme I, PtsP